MGILDPPIPQRMAHLASVYTMGGRARNPKNRSDVQSKWNRWCFTG